MLTFFLEAGDTFRATLDNANSDQFLVDFFSDVPESRLTFEPGPIPVSLDVPIVHTGPYTLAILNTLPQDATYDLAIEIEGEVDCGEDHLEEASRRQQVLDPGLYEDLALCDADRHDTFWIDGERGDDMVVTVTLDQPEEGVVLSIFSTILVFTQTVAVEDGTGSLQVTLPESYPYFIQVASENGAPVLYDLEVARN